MPQTRRTRLEQLPGWRWNANHIAKWEAQYLALQAFLSDTGGRYPSKCATESTERCLNRWVSRQRRMSSAGGEDQAVRLQSLPGWQWCLPNVPTTTYRAGPSVEWFGLG